MKSRIPHGIKPACRQERLFDTAFRPGEKVQSSCTGQHTQYWALCGCIADPPQSECQVKVPVAKAGQNVVVEAVPLSTAYIHS